MEWCPAGWLVSASVNLPLHHKEVLIWHRLTRVVPEKGRKNVCGGCTVADKDQTTG